MLPWGAEGGGADSLCNPNDTVCVEVRSKKYDVAITMYDALPSNCAVRFLLRWVLQLQLSKTQHRNRA
jgi:hypothetical protein